MKEAACDVLVIGAGPGGYVCAIRCGQAGLQTIVVDRGPVGGTCLNVGCIPSKALIHIADEFGRIAGADGQLPAGLSVTGLRFDMVAATEWRDTLVARLGDGVKALLARSGVTCIAGEARLRDGKSAIIQTRDGPLMVTARAVVIATGSQPVELADLPFGGPVLSSTEALALDHVPERLAIVGAGYIGLEIGTAFAKLGSRVAIVEASGQLLPHLPADLVRPVAARLGELGVAVHLGTTALGHDAGKGALIVSDRCGTTQQIDADRVLVAVGRRPALEAVNADALALVRDGPFLRVDDRCETSMRGVHAIGDVTGEPMLAHRAMAQGELVADVLAGRRRRWDVRAVPAVCYTDPEIVTVRRQPADPEQETVSARFPLRANARSLTLGAGSGFVGLVARKEDHLVVEAHAVGAGVSELAGQFSLAMEMGARLEDLAATIQAHPTLGEGIAEAAAAALGRPLHA